MTRRLGCWWIRDTIDTRRMEAQGFCSVLDPLSGFEWTQDHGDSDVLEKDFVETINYNEKADQVDALMMSSHGNPDEFTVSDGKVSTWDSIRFGKGDLEIFATHACKLLEHTNSNSLSRWIPAFERLHYMFGFHTSSWSYPEQKWRGTYFAMYAAYLYYAFGFSYTLREAWKKANVLIEGSNVKWAYLRCTGNDSQGNSADTYNEKLRSTETRDPTHNRSFWTARGTC